MKAKPQLFTLFDLNFWHFQTILAFQSLPVWCNCVNEATFARNVKCDFFCDFQTPCHCWCKVIADSNLIYGYFIGEWPDHQYLLEWCFCRDKWPYFPRTITAVVSPILVYEINWWKKIGEAGGVGNCTYYPGFPTAILSCQRGSINFVKLSHA